ncbi:amino acid ABC transporter ATP-binding protein [Actinomyces vulturis]|uniref:amino acid ABC transporter ATP-binding protein n=1 Tax=Actinomyces vulturis TaxID=1857645 RepID=UPI00083343CF|nr:amino acid ABC transporter ATP-binding protein [Actinomyces vulturis]
MLTITNLYKSYGENQVLKGVSLSVDAGEVCVLVGPSGGGKTTLLRCINQLTTPDSGEIVIDGVNLSSVSNVREWHRKVGMVFQDFNLFPHRTALENITEAPIYVYGEDRTTAEARGRDLLELVGLSDKADSYPDELSGGQRQRVAIARSCALEPKVLCFDEPTSALDDASTARVVGLIRTLADTGMAIVAITHDKEFAKQAGDVVYRVEHGVISQ